MNRLLLWIAVPLSLCAQAFAQAIVVPNANATVDGGDHSGTLPTMPFSFEGQFVFGTGQFPGGPIYVTGFTWRAAPGLGPLNLTFSGSIYASTSPNYPNTKNGKTLLSTTFAANVGPDKTLVFSGNNATMAGAGCPGPAPCPWANTVAFTTPFLYNPNGGPLLIDLQGSFSATGQFDVVDCPAPGCSVANVFGTPLGSATAQTFNYGGNVTELTYTNAASFFSAGLLLSNAVYYLQLQDGNPFGYYSFLQGSPSTNAIIYHFDLGYEYATLADSTGAVFLYDFGSGHWWYSSSSVFPYLYDFTLNAWLYYFPDTQSPGRYTSNPRYFSNLSTGRIITM